MTQIQRDHCQSIDAFISEVVAQSKGVGRFCGLFATAERSGVRLDVLFATDSQLRLTSVLSPESEEGFPSLTPYIPSAAWYEREIFDLFGLLATGSSGPYPLVLPLSKNLPRPRPGSGFAKLRDPFEIDLTPLPAHLQGEGVFTIPYGPVRSGVFESVEYVVETVGEDVSHLRPRVFYKHRGVQVAFEGLDISDGVLMAERSEGVASVANGVAYCSALERIAGVEPPSVAAFLRVIHAELERIANHLDSIIRHCEAAGQAVAYSRFSLHKERLQRLRGGMCGSRFGRGVVVPGGVSGPPLISTKELLGKLDEIEKDLRSDLRLLMATPSFLDRLTGTGVLSPALAHRFAAVGPVGRGSGQGNDVRFTRAYDGYQHLGHQLIETRLEGDALSRQWVRIDEIYGSFHLIRQATDRLDRAGHSSSMWRSSMWRNNLGVVSGEDWGWAEAPQGELLYLVKVEDNKLIRVKPRSASFHNFGLFQAAFPSDILTDFAFIEASFGISIAGVAG